MYEMEENHSEFHMEDLAQCGSEGTERLKNAY